MSLANEPLDAHFRRPQPAPARSTAGTPPLPRSFVGAGRGAGRPGVGQLLALQGMAGNAPVQRLLADSAGQGVPPGDLTLSRFEGPEHRRLGDKTGATIDLGGGVVLSWGQVVGLAGDEFGSV